MGTLIQDLRYAFRVLRNHPGFTALVVVTVARGIGANTAMFSVTDAVLLRPLPFRDPRKNCSFPGLSALDFNSLGNDVARWAEWVEKSKTLEVIAVYETGELNQAGVGEAERVSAVVSRHFFPLLGIAALRGRTFLPQEIQPGYEPVAVISYRCV
jgi:putative ABC transport system permease protein